MKTVHLLKRLGDYPLFTENHIAKILNKTPKYTRTLLQRLSKRGLIKRIERGKYTVHEDEMIFASYLVTPSYLSLWTALRYYNMTQQQPHGIFVISPTSKKTIKLKNTKIIFKKSGHVFGYKKERYADFDILIADEEKTIIDALLFKIPLQEVIYALNTEINCKKLAEYAKKTKNKSLIKRLGYILQEIKGNSYSLRAMDNNYVVLDYLHKRKGGKNRKWKLIVNIKV